MRRLAVLTVLLLVVAACDAALPSGSPGSPSHVAATPAPTGPAASPEVPTEPPTGSPTAAPTDAPSEEPPEPDPAAFLQVCRGFHGPHARAPLPCEDAVATALTALSVTAPSRVDVRFDCSGPACVEPDPGRAYVTVLNDGTATEVEVTMAADGTVEASATRPGAEATAPAFTAPSPARAALPGAPGSLATRPAYPLCGQEETPMAGPYDDAARTCFLTGVLAGSPVEFVSQGAGTEGNPYVHLYRYSGTGGLELVTGEGDTWLRAFTGIAEADGGLVFGVGGLSTRREPVP